MISDTHKFVFVHIPRTGGTSIEVALAPYSKSPVEIVAGGNTALPYKHAKARELRAIIGAGWGGYFSFATVRDPWERMVSDYAFFQQIGPKLYDLFSPRERQFTDSARALSFGDWLSQNAEDLSMCQLDYLSDERGEVIVDRICRLETLREDFEAICRHLQVSVDLPWINRSSRPPRRDAYDPQSAALVAELCARDISYFGYSFEGLTA